MKKRKINKKEFAEKVAKVMDDLKSSHVYFILQMAFGDDLAWYEAQEILNRVKKK